MITNADAGGPRRRSDAASCRSEHSRHIMHPRVALCAAVAIVIFCAVIDTSPACGEQLPPAPAGKQWKLIWGDDFEGDTLDESKWNRLGDVERRDGYWIKDDAYVSGEGTLVLRTRRDGDRFTCGAVDSRNKFQHAFGYYVARCKMPTQPGHWPAFWMMCAGVSKVGDGGRDGTEIDIVEIPERDGQVFMNLHWDGYGEHHQSAGTKAMIPAPIDGFHEYGLLWTEEEYIFYVDGAEVWRTQAGGVSQVPEYLLLTEEIGKWKGDIADAELPDFFEVDYVRVYDLSE
jgi:beta-glucanase (GH16 family)